MSDRIELIDITPEMAQDWLRNKHYPRQRKLRQPWVDHLTREILAGRFRLSSLDIRSVDGREFVINGQHRLHAIIQAGVPVPMVVTVKDSANMEEVG